MDTNYLKIGTNFGFTSGSDESFHRAGCILDCGIEETACNVICSESKQTTIDSTSDNVINQILYITPTNIVFYKLNSNGDTKKETIDVPDGYNYQKLLSVAWASQNGCKTKGHSNYETAVHFAQYISRNTTWKDTLNSKLNNKIEFWSTNSSNYDNTLDYKDYVVNTGNHQYSGIFVFYSIGKGSGQGRMAYRVVRNTNCKVELRFTKKDFNGNGLKNARIKITAIENVDDIDGLNSNQILRSKNNGSFGTIIVYPDNINNNIFRIKLEETNDNAPEGYKGLPEEVILIVKYNKDGTVEEIESSNTTYVPNKKNTNNVVVKNKPILNLNINKTDSLTGNKLSGVRFRVELTNVAAIPGHFDTPSKGKKVLEATTDENGQIKLRGIEPNKVGQKIIVKITEVAVPNTEGKGYVYKKIDPITVTISYDAKKKTYSVSGYKNARVSGNTVTVPIKNKPYINLSGMVWNDGQTGIKDIAGPNGKKDNGENGISGVSVELYSVKNKKVIKSAKTNENGQYKFENVEKTDEGYKIIFNYGGINYIETRASGSKGTDSKALEVKRTEFNNRFKTISSGKSNDGTPLTYDYKDNNSTLKVNMDGTNPASQNKNFRMQAQTGTYKTSTENIDCGLVKKEFDLAIRNRCKECKIRIK